MLICSTPRSGSWLLADAIRDTGLIGIPYEYFREDYRPLFLEEWGLSTSERYDNYIRAATIAGSTPNGVFSCKIHWAQMAILLNSMRLIEDYRLMGVRDLIGRFFPGAIYVFLSREDKARQAISYFRAMATDVWWQAADESPRPHAYVPVADWSSIAHLEKLLGRQELAWEYFFAAVGANPVSVTYEALDGNYSTAVRKVLDSLDMPGTARLRIASPRLIKQADAITEEWLVTYQEWKTLQPPR